MTQPLVAMPADIRQFDNYTWHAVPDQYVQAALSASGVFPVIVPALGERLDLSSLLDKVDGVMLTGSKTNVHPSLYKKEATEADGPYDEARDSTTMPLINLAIERGIPLLAICRGIQELNVALGGSLVTEIQEGDGMWDHRAPEIGTQDERFAIRQAVRIEPGTCLASIFGAGEIQVNSLHRQAIGAKAPRLQIEALAEDGTIEAVSVTGSKAFAVGVQWHPEYWAQSDRNSARIFEAFGEAVRQHAAGRGEGRQAAE